MNAVHAAHGAEPALGHEAINALEIAERACAPNAAFSSLEQNGWYQAFLSPAGVDRTDLEHTQITRSCTRLSTIVPASRPVIVDIMLHERDAHLDLLPRGDADAGRQSALRTVAFAKREIEAWLREGDDQDAFDIARFALNGASPSAFESTRITNDQNHLHANKLWLRHPTSWSPLRVGLLNSSSQDERATMATIEAIGDAMAPPVVSLEFQPSDHQLRVTISPVVVCRTFANQNILAAMRDLSHANERMKARRP